MFSAFMAAGCVVGGRKQGDVTGDGRRCATARHDVRPALQRFLDVYAALCRFHMKTYGTTAAADRRGAAKNHRSRCKPVAQFQSRSPSTVLASLYRHPLTS
jgi:hypothetical protein